VKQGSGGKKRGHLELIRWRRRGGGGRSKGGERLAKFRPDEEISYGAVGGEIFRSQHGVNRHGKVPGKEESGDPSERSSEALFPEKNPDPEPEKAEVGIDEAGPEPGVIAPGGFIDETSHNGKNGLVISGPTGAGEDSGKYEGRKDHGLEP
jgi:hypothetical protein